MRIKGSETYLKSIGIQSFSFRNRRIKFLKLGWAMFCRPSYDFSFWRMSRGIGWGRWLATLIAPILIVP